MARYGLFVLKVPLNLNQPTVTRYLCNNNFATSSALTEICASLSNNTLFDIDVFHWSNGALEEEQSVIQTSKPDVHAAGRHWSVRVYGVEGTDC